MASTKHQEPQEEDKKCPYVYNMQWDHPTNKSPVGETAIYRSPEFANRGELSCFLEPHLQTVQDLFLRNFREFPDEIFLGHRPLISDKGNIRASKYTWFTNREYEEVSKNLGSGIVDLKMAPAVSEFQNYT